jgi:hypothetical protein
MDYWRDHGQYKWVPFRGIPAEKKSFPEAFLFAFQRLINGVNQGGDSEAKEELADRAFSYLDGLDEEKKKELLVAANVEEISRENAMKILAIQGGLVGTGIATELAGFAAYILAAKASAIIPLVGGKTMVSMLAVVANPLFIIPAVLVVGGVFGATATSEIKRFMAMNVLTILTLRGVAAEAPSVEPLIGVMRALPEHLPEELVTSYRQARDAGTDADKGWEIVKMIGSTVWRNGKAAFDVEQYPNMVGYLERWEISMGRKV